MARTPWYCRTIVLASILAVSASSALGQSGRVALVKTPAGGIQPQAVCDSQGVVHLVYFKGPATGGDLYYVRSQPGSTEFTPPIRVNRQDGSAVAAGTIRGGQIALGKGGRVHVVWNGSSSARPANPIQGAPMLYTRSREAELGFEPERNVMSRTYGLDGGGTVAADAAGTVYVAWHGRTADDPDGEEGRRFWITRSKDEGTSFSPEEPVLARKSGACACCGTKALVDSKGTLYALYRAASGKVNRDMILLTSKDQGEQFQATSLQPWRVAVCPMSSEALVEGPSGVVAAWETMGQVAFAKIDPQTRDVTTPIAPPGEGQRKHPALAVNAQGETLLVWAEGTGWQRGGALVWRIFDAAGQATRESGRIEGGIPVWGLPTAVARPDGGFTVIH